MKKFIIICLLIMPALLLAKAPYISSNLQSLQISNAQCESISLRALRAVGFKSKLKRISAGFIVGVKGNNKAIVRCYAGSNLVSFIVAGSDKNVGTYLNRIVGYFK